ncbi:glycosyltransferase [Virgibacillus flavescens]|uniref:glycosyltransferase n=1 Tax=Virgibacillus flavescens TaxID=1611422 RepID=UPI003D3356C7
MLINMNVGGTEKALLNMISEIPKAEYDITILMLEKYGGFLDSIPSYVKVEYVKEYSELKEVINQPPKKVGISFIKKGKIFRGTVFLFVYLLSKLLNNKSIFFKYILKDVSEVKQEYDIAVAYAGPMDFISYFVIHKIKAKKKYQWIHFDVTKIGLDVKFAANLYRNFDKILVVSNEAKRKLVGLVPIVEEKSEVFLNMVSPKVIQRQSNEGIGFNDNFNGVRILTVGRLAIEKGQDLAILALARLVQEGYNVKWYCVGEGNARMEYERLIEEYDLQDKFILLGSDPNPYTYLKECDIYVQPSRYEGYCISLIEAKCLNKPIITTDVNGAKEQIINGETGFIVDIDEREIFGSLMKLLQSPRLCQEFRDNLSNEEINTVKLVGI